MRSNPKELHPFSAWNRAIAELLENDPTAQGYHDLIRSLIDFDVLMVFEYAIGSAKSLFHTATDGRGKVIIDDYLQGPFLLDPFYTRSISDPDVGLMVMRHLSPDRFQKSEFYRRHYHLTGIADEIGITFGLHSDASTVVSITRNKSQARFNAADKSRFAAAAPVLTAFARRLWQDPDRPARPPATRRMENAFDDFGKNVLSRREVEILSLILKGHSSLSVGEVLNISPGTVKIHRKNIYSKLNISSQAELFNKFIQHLSAS